MRTLLSRRTTPSQGRARLKVAYVFITPRAATYKLAQMILPQLEAGAHGVEVVGMFFCGSGRTEPGHSEPVSMIEGLQVGCFPDLQSRPPSAKTLHRV